MSSDDATDGTERPLRYATLVFSPARSVHPTVPVLCDAADVSPTAVRQTRLLDDGTVVTLCRVRGDDADVRSALAAAPPVLSFAVAGTGDCLVYSHSEPHDLAAGLLELRDSHAVALRMPLRFTDDGGLRGTVVGDDATLQRTVAALPDAIDVELERTGDYYPDTDGLWAGLTARQRELLATAIRDGYYEHPRETSQTELAERLDLAPGTVSERLRRIESSVFTDRLLGAYGSPGGA